MELEKFKEAKRLRDLIAHVEVKMTQIQKMQARKDDEEFTSLREQCYNSYEALPYQNSKNLNTITND